MIAIGVRRSTQIKPEDFDFDQGCLDEDDFTAEHLHSRVYSASTKRMLARIIVAQCEFAVARIPTLTAAYADTDQDLAEEPSKPSLLVTTMAQIDRAKTELAD
jgi:hypothetical protein